MLKGKFELFGINSQRSHTVYDWPLPVLPRVGETLEFYTKEIIYSGEITKVAHVITDRIGETPVILIAIKD